MGGGGWGRGGGLSGCMGMTTRKLGGDRPTINGNWLNQRTGPMDSSSVSGSGSSCFLTWLSMSKNSTFF
jgi:hypothetical protein